MPFLGFFTFQTKPVHTSSCKTHPLEEKVANGIDVDSDNCINGKEMATELKSNSATDNHINNVCTSLYRVSFFSKLS